MLKKQAIYADYSPSAVDAERSLLGVVFLREAAYYEMLAFGMKAELLSVDAHTRIFLAMGRVVDGGQQPDMVTLCDELRAKGELATVGDIGYIAALADGV